MYKPIKTISIAKDGGKYMLVLGDRTGAGVSAGIYDTQKDAINMLTYCMGLFGIDEAVAVTNEEKVLYQLIAKNRNTGWKHIIGRYKTEDEVINAAGKINKRTIGVFGQLLVHRETTVITKLDGKAISKKIKESAEWIA